MRIHKEFVANYVTVMHAKGHGHAINMHGHLKSKFSKPSHQLLYLGSSRKTNEFARINQINNHYVFAFSFFTFARNPVRWRIWSLSRF